MGLVARAIEAVGIPTVSISIVREITEKTPPPRALFVRFPFGHALGEPGNRNQQFAILQQAFLLLFSAQQPGTIRDAGFLWRRTRYAAPNWAEFQDLAPR